jgi:hypothetical protein
MAPDAIAVRVLSGYRLAVDFADGYSGIVDCTGWVHERETGLYAELRDPVRFAEVRVHPDGFLEWPNGVDICPDVLYEEAHPATGETASRTLPAE